jgi:hypothetical protein
MVQSIQLALIKIQLSIKTVFFVLTRWKYFLLAVGVSFLFFELMYWAFNLNVLFIILSSWKLSIIEKLEVLASPLFSSSGPTAAILMVVLSAIQGMNISILAYIIRKQKKIDVKLAGESSLIGVLAIIGLGCPSCGTSLITPIVALFMSTSAVAVSEKITAVMLPLAIILGLYGLYSVGIKAANIRSQINLKYSDTNVAPTS